MKSRDRLLSDYGFAKAIAAMSYADLFALRRDLASDFDSEGGPRTSAMIFDLQNYIEARMKAIRDGLAFGYPSYRKMIDEAPMREP